MTKTISIVKINVCDRECNPIELYAAAFTNTAEADAYKATLEADLERDVAAYEERGADKKAIEARWTWLGKSDFNVRSLLAGSEGYADNQIVIATVPLHAEGAPSRVAA